jgi:hypothetical protein
MKDRGFDNSIVHNIQLWSHPINDNKQNSFSILTTMASQLQFAMWKTMKHFKANTNPPIEECVQ